MRKLLVLVAALAFVGGACGGDDSDGGSDATTTTKAPRVDLTPKLLTVADLPAGFTEAEVEDDESENGCAAIDAFEKKYDDAGDAAAEVQFEKAGDEGADLISEEVTKFASTAAAHSAFEEGKAAYTSCPTVETTDDDGTTLKGKLEPFEIEQLGDETLGFVLTATLTSEGEESVFESVLVVIRKADVIAATQVASVGATSLKSEDFDAIIDKVVAKL